MAIISAVTVVLWPSHRKQQSCRRSVAVWELGGLEVGAGASAQIGLSGPEKRVQNTQNRKKDQIWGSG